MIYRDRIIRQRGTAVAGAYGSPDEVSWTTPQEEPYPAVVVAPSSTEDVALAQRVEASYLVQVYPGADVLPTDRVVWAGETFEVTGGIEKLAAFGWVHALRFGIRQVTGG